MRYLIIILTFLLFSCSKSEILQNRSLNNKGDDYFASLAEGYNLLSKWEAEQYDWGTSDLFAKKGIAALNKRLVEPLNPQEMEITDPLLLEELITARNKMQEILDINTKFTFPLKAAHLQIAYESWAEQTEEAWQANDISKFREQFYKALADLEDAIKLSQIIDYHEVANKNYQTIFFDHNHYQIDKTAEKELNKLIFYLNTLDDYKIVLEGHTDPTGNYSYNYNLSQLRVAEVRNYLINNNIPYNKIIKETYKGSDELAIKLDQGGITERLNRRVEIYIIKE